MEKLTPGVYRVYVMLEPDDVTHVRAKSELSKELGSFVERGFQINGIREPIYGLNDAGERIVIGYESLAWLPASTSQATRYPPRVRDDDDDDFVLTPNGLELRL
ncbi:hypothetical protein ACMHYO_11455 [Allopusillimonas ginsengisoli]|uniref:hypothetical protein n=1 Tax=Allopusillimonas ginsengisoli TaxID=453575 RepID=UPI0039C19075